MTSIIEYENRRRRSHLVLGGIVLILAGLSGLSLVGQSAPTRAWRTLMAQRLTKARLAEDGRGRHCGDRCEHGKDDPTKKRQRDLPRRSRARKKNARRHWKNSRALADTPTSIKHGADMAELSSRARRPNNDDEASRRGPVCGGGRRAFALSAQWPTNLRAKANEAAQFQEAALLESEKTARKPRALSGCR